MTERIYGAMQGGEIVRMNILETHATRGEGYFRHRVELKKIEIFLDFDPVSPDWPPAHPMDDALQKGRNVEAIHERDHEELPAL